MSTNRILRPRSGSTGTRPPVGAKPIAVLTKPTEGKTTATSGAASKSGVGTVTAVKGASMERLIERLENELSRLNSERYRKILSRKMLPYARETFGSEEHYIFQHDNDSKHTSQTVKC